MKEITKLENTSLSDFKLHTEECEKRAFFHGLFVPLKRHVWKCERN